VAQQLKEYRWVLQVYAVLTAGGCGGWAAGGCGGCVAGTWDKLPQLMLQQQLELLLPQLRLLVSCLWLVVRG
jgi:hypothetical protein